MQAIFRNRQLILYSFALGVVLMVIRTLGLRLVLFSQLTEVYIASIAILFMIIGVWAASKIYVPKTVVIEKSSTPGSGFVFNESDCRELNISKRELEVLELMARGHSNPEIASMLFVSENTVKTHVSKIFAKLEVRRRTQAIDIAKKRSLVP